MGGGEGSWKGGTEVVPDFEYDHSLRPPHAKIARTPLVFTQRHRLADRFTNRSETDGKEGTRKGKMDTRGLDTEEEGARAEVVGEGPERGESSRSPSRRWR